MGGEIQAPVRVDVCTMKTSAGADYYVRFRCDGREVTPHMFKERYKAEYTADHYAWVFGLRPDEPDLMAYGPESHPDIPTMTLKREGQP